MATVPPRPSPNVYEFRRPSTPISQQIELLQEQLRGQLQGQQSTDASSLQVLMHVRERCNRLAEENRSLKVGNERLRGEVQAYKTTLGGLRDYLAEVSLHIPSILVETSLSDESVKRLEEWRGTFDDIVAATIAKAVQVKNEQKTDREHYADRLDEKGEHQDVEGGSDNRDLGQAQDRRRT